VSDTLIVIRFISGSNARSIAPTKLIQTAQSGEEASHRNRQSMVVPRQGKLPGRARKHVSPNDPRENVLHGAIVAEAVLTAQMRGVAVVNLCKPTIRHITHLLAEKTLRDKIRQPGFSWATRWLIRRQDQLFDRCYSQRGRKNPCQSLYGYDGSHHHLEYDPELSRWRCQMVRQVMER
jgi:hypothetical protein